MTKSQIFAYLAGVIDSDGCIGIRKSTYAQRVRGDAQAAIYSCRVCCKQVTPEAVTLLKETFGGALMKQRSSTPNGRPMFYWEIHSRSGIDCLNALLPYLRIKKPQAINCIELGKLIRKSKIQRVARGRGHVGAACRSPVLTAAMEQRYLDAKVMNRVGVAAA